MSNTHCVSEHDLRAYVLGELPEKIGKYVSDHLEHCADCESIAQSLDTLCDPAQAALRQVFHPDTSIELAHSDTLLTSPQSLPERVGDYTVLEELGHGGMSVVYKARQDRPNRIVALKLLLGGRHSGAERRARFNAEADTIARLHHPNIVQVYEAGEHDGLPYLILEFCSGGNLARRLNGLPQTPSLAVQWLVPMVRALAHAHQAGVVHRDLKPANVLLTEDGQIKISDFGLARAERPELTATGAILGTPSYMAPEQAASCKEVGPRADIYALGAILYEMLTGRPPFQGASALETLAQVRDQEPVSPRRLQPNIPRDLETICLTCLQKNPSKRYASADALASDLKLFQEGHPIWARPIGTLGRTWRWCARNPGWAAMLASVTVLLTVIAIGASIGVILLGQALSDSEAGRRDANTNLERAQKAELTTEEKLFEAELAQARGNALSRRIGQRFNSLTVLEEAAQRARKLNLPPQKFLDLRNAAISALARPDIRVVQEWEGFPDGTRWLAFHPDLSIYTRIDVDNHCDIRRVIDDQLIERLPLPGTWASFSPDGRFLASGHGIQLHIWRLENGRVDRILSEQAIYLGGFHPTSSYVALVHTTGAVDIWDLDQHKRLTTLQAGSITREKVVAFHPTESRIAAVSYFSKMAVISDWRTDEVLQTIDLPHSSYDVAWNPRGDRLAISDGDGKNIHLFDGEAKQELQTIRVSNSGTRLTFNPAGDLLATRDWYGTTHLIDVATGQSLVQAQGTKVQNPMWRPQFSRDGRLLAAEIVGNQTGIWEIAAGREYRTYLTLPSAQEQTLYWPHIDADSRFVVVLGNDSKHYSIHYWELDSGNWIGRQEGDFAGYANLFTTTDSHSLITSTRAGLVRWAVQTPQNESGVLRLTSPKTVSKVVSYAIDCSRDGTVLVASARIVGNHQPFAGSWVYRAERPDSPLYLDQGKDVGHIAVSPDGHWVATCPHPTGKINVYDSRDGRLETVLGNTGSQFPRFSPDGRWLSLSGDNGEVYATGSWTLARRYSGRAQFSPDSRLLAISTGSGVIRLLDFERNTELARFEDPNQVMDHFHLFSPDGTRLITASNGKNSGVHVWDLRAIGRGLKELGLDWEAPDYPQESVAQHRALRLEIVR
ncbi:MAG TPA: WD40 repeat domain-containing serine/threonine-protein kinase [Gemmata sp.]|nr:WD40 repeat domain-containing serine/threonine-protein kinase [Gemmata sp.]